MQRFKANHDVQICIDPYAAGQYILNYLKIYIQKMLKKLLKENVSLIEANRAIFEKYKLMTDPIMTIQNDDDSKDKNNTEEEEVETIHIETASALDIDSFNKWAKSQACKGLSKFKNLTSMTNIDELRNKIS